MRGVGGGLDARQPRSITAANCIQSPPVPDHVKNSHRHLSSPSQRCRAGGQPSPLPTIPSDPRYMLYIKKAESYYGVTRTREIHEVAIKVSQAGSLERNI